MADYKSALFKAQLQDYSAGLTGNACRLPRGSPVVEFEFGYQYQAMRLVSTGTRLFFTNDPRHPGHVWHATVNETRQQNGIMSRLRKEPPPTAGHSRYRQLHGI